MHRSALTPLLYFALAVASSAGCGSSTATSVISPDVSRCQPTLTPTASTYQASGGTGTLNVSVARDCTWSAASQAPWIVLTSPREGQGDGSVAYRIDTNNDPVTRRGALAVGDARTELAQDAAPCRYQVLAAADPIGGDGGERAIDVRTHAACSWTAVSTAPWLTVTPASGRGDASLRVSVTLNDGATRTGEVSIAGERVSLTQLARALLPPAPAPAPPAPAPEPAPPPTPGPPSPGPTPTPPAPTPTPPAPTPPPVPVADVKFEGRVEARSGSCPSLAIRVAGRNVTTDRDTEFRKGPCKDIEVGSGVEVEGRLMSDGLVRAERVEIERR